MLSVRPINQSINQPTEQTSMSNSPPTRLWSFGLKSGVLPFIRAGGSTSRAGTWVLMETIVAWGPSTVAGCATASFCFRWSSCCIGSIWWTKNSKDELYKCIFFHDILSPHRLTATAWSLRQSGWHGRASFWRGGRIGGALFAGGEFLHTNGDGTELRRVLSQRPCVELRTGRGGFDGTRETGFFHTNGDAVDWRRGLFTEWDRVFTEWDRGLALDATVDFLAGELVHVKGDFVVELRSGLLTFGYVNGPCFDNGAGFRSRRWFFQSSRSWILKRNCRTECVDWKNLRFNERNLSWIMVRSRACESANTRSMDWLIDRLIDWFAEGRDQWLIDWLINWLIDWLIWLIGWMILLNRMKQTETTQSSLTGIQSGSSLIHSGCACFRLTAGFLSFTNADAPFFPSYPFWLLSHCPGFWLPKSPAKLVLGCGVLALTVDAENRFISWIFASQILNHEKMKEKNIKIKTTKSR